MRPINNLVNPMLTDLYQLTMAYGYWKSGRHNDKAVFDLFFRKNPFGGEFTIFAGLEEVLRFVGNFKFTDEDIKFLRYGKVASKKELQKNFQRNLELGMIRQLEGGRYQELRFGSWDSEYWVDIEYPTKDVFVKAPLEGCDSDFFEWLGSVDCSGIKIYALPEGTIAFPKVPLIRVEGPLAIAQMLETTLLNLVNFPSLIATNAARFRLAAGPDKILSEFGLRRSQGPDGAVSASRYSHMGGFDSTSNVLAGMLYDIQIQGTHAHAYVQSFTSLEDLKNRMLKPNKSAEAVDFVSAVLKYRERLGFNNTNDGELAAFISYAQAFPNKFLALVDTYDTLRSGVPNFLCVACALDELGYRAIGIRLDSGDLAYLSKEARKMFADAWGRMNKQAPKLTIVASNDINEDVLHSLKEQGHEVDVFGIGTHLVTCQAQPALGCVYKLVEINGNPRIKLSNQSEKTTLPGRKTAFRLFGTGGFPLIDFMICDGEAPPIIGESVLCMDPFDAMKRVRVNPTSVLQLHRCWWDGKLTNMEQTREQARAWVLFQLKNIRQDHLRHVNPAPYKVAVSEMLHDMIIKLWGHEAPIEEIG